MTDYTTYDDAALLRVVSAEEGEGAAAFTALYERHAMRLYYNVLAMVKDPLLAEESVQEVFSRLWKRRSSIQIQTSVEGYLHTACRNFVYDYFTRAKRDRQALEALQQAASAGVAQNMEQSAEQLAQQQWEAVTSPGIIQRIWITISDRSFAMLRSLRLRMYWDGAPTAAVDVPLGDFFMAPLGRPVAFQSALFSNPEGRSFNCYIPMPFKKGARVVITNEGPKDLRQLYYDIDFIETHKAPEHMLYFHSAWQREIKGAPEKDLVLLPTIQGKGRFLGVNVGVNVDSSYGSTWWGEGEVKMYIDGDTSLPTFTGTGTEDYIGTGWGEGVFMHQYQGCMVADEKKRQYSFYRFHIPDAIWFYKNISVTLQKMGGGDDPEVKALAAKGLPLIPVSVITANGFVRLLDNPVATTDPAFPKGWVNFFRTDDYCATSYFYLDKPVSNLGELVVVSERVK